MYWFFHTIFMDFPEGQMDFFSTKGRACSFCRSAYHLPLMMFWAFWFWKRGFMCRFEEHWLRLGWLADAPFRNLEIVFHSQRPWALPQEGGENEAIDSLWQRDSSLEKMNRRQGACELQGLCQHWPWQSFVIKSKIIVPFWEGLFLLFQVYPFYYEAKCSLTYKMLWWEVEFFYLLTWKNKIWPTVDLSN